MYSSELIAFRMYENGINMSDICEICNCKHNEIVDIVKKRIDKLNPTAVKKFKEDRNELIKTDFLTMKSLKRIASLYNCRIEFLQELFGIEDISVEGLLKYHEKDILSDFFYGYSVADLSFKYGIEENHLFKFLDYKCERYIRLKGGNFFNILCVGKALRYLEGTNCSSVETFSKQSHYPVGNVKKMITGLKYCDNQELEDIRSYLATVTSKGNYKGTAMKPDEVWRCLELKQQGYSNTAIAAMMGVPDYKINKCLGLFKKYGMI